MNVLGTGALDLHATIWRWLLLRILWRSESLLHFQRDLDVFVQAALRRLLLFLNLGDSSLVRAPSVLLHPHSYIATKFRDMLYILIILVGSLLLQHDSHIGIASLMQLQVVVLLNSLVVLILVFVVDLWHSFLALNSVPNAELAVSVLAAHIQLLLPVKR